MEIVPTKIDWKKFKKLFPKENGGWELPLSAEFPDRDLKGLHMAYVYAMDAMYSKLPAGLRKPFGLFVAATIPIHLECVSFEPFEITADNDPEEWMDGGLPHLDPRAMKQVAAAVEKIKSEDNQTEIADAWSKSTAKDNPDVTDLLPEAQDFVDYLGNWIEAFEEIHKDGAVLGICIA